MDEDDGGGGDVLKTNEWLQNEDLVTSSFP